MNRYLAFASALFVGGSLALGAEGDTEAVLNWLDILGFLIQLILLISLWVWIGKKVETHLQMQGHILRRLDQIEEHTKQTAKTTTYLSDVTAESRGEG